MILSMMRLSIADGERIDAASTSAVDQFGRVNRNRILSRRHGATHVRTNADDSCVAPNVREYSTSSDRHLYCFNCEVVRFETRPRCTIHRTSPSSMFTRITMRYAVFIPSRRVQSREPNSLVESERELREAGSVGQPFGLVAGSPKRSRKMDWVRESSWARAARRLARNASARSSTSAIRRCSASGGRGMSRCLQVYRMLTPG